jgi:hypothetical protein
MTGGGIGGPSGSNWGESVSALLTTFSESNLGSNGWTTLRIASLEDVELVMLVLVDVRLVMTVWTHCAMGCRRLWPVRGPGSPILFRRCAHGSGGKEGIDALSQVSSAAKRSARVASRALPARWHRRALGRGLGGR